MDTVTEAAVPAAAVAVVVYLVNVLKMMGWMPPWGPPLLAVIFGWCALVAVRVASGQAFSPVFWAAVFIGGFLVAQAAGGIDNTSKRAAQEQTEMRASRARKQGKGRTRPANQAPRRRRVVVPTSPPVPPRA